MKRWAMVIGWVCAGVAQAASPWRVCVPDAPFPPLLNNDPERLGIAERLMVETGRRAGLQVSFERLPYQRCLALVREGALEALAAPAVAANAPGLQFPRRANGELDPTRMLARAALLWLQKPGGALRWDGRQLQGLAEGATVGMRNGMQAGVPRLKELGLKVDQNAKDATQLLRMVQTGRLPAAVLLEFEFNGVAFEFKDRIEVLARPLQVETYYLVTAATLEAERQAELNEWWRQISLLRDSIAFKP